MINPITSYQAGLGSGAIKKITFQNFQTKAERTSLFSYTFYTSPSKINQRLDQTLAPLLKVVNPNVMLPTIGQSIFTYREDGKTIYRNQMQQIVVDQFEQMSNRDVALLQPNSYLWKYTEQYLQAPIESNKYAFMTDSVPFVSLVLSGSARLSSPYYNYVSDYPLYRLRLLEYGIDPAFFLTKESTHLLRHTNSASIYTSFYDLWKDFVVKEGSMYQDIQNRTRGKAMLSHRYIQDGVSETVYEGNVRVYVNYRDHDVVLPNQVIVKSYEGVVVS